MPLGSLGRSDMVRAKGLENDAGGMFDDAESSEEDPEAAEAAAVVAPAPAVAAGDFPTLGQASAVKAPLLMKRPAAASEREPEPEDEPEDEHSDDDDEGVVVGDASAAVQTAGGEEEVVVGGEADDELEEKMYDASAAAAAERGEEPDDGDGEWVTLSNITEIKARVSNKNCEPAAKTGTVVSMSSHPPSILLSCCPPLPSVVVVMYFTCELPNPLRGGIHTSASCCLCARRCRRLPASRPTLRCRMS